MCVYVRPSSLLVGPTAVLGAGASAVVMPYLLPTPAETWPADQYIQSPVHSETAECRDVRVESTSRAKRAFEASSDRARRAGLYTLSSVRFHISLKSLAREKGEKQESGAVCFFSQAGGSATTKLGHLRCDREIHICPAEAS